MDASIMNTNASMLFGNNTMEDVLFASKKVEEFTKRLELINKKMFQASVEIRRRSENLTVVKALKMEIEALDQERKHLRDVVEEYESIAKGKLFEHYVDTPKNEEIVENVESQPLKTMEEPVVEQDFSQNLQSEYQQIQSEEIIPNQTPIFEEPTFQEPVYEESVFEESVAEEPVYEESQSESISLQQTPIYEEKLEENPISYQEEFNNSVENYSEMEYGQDFTEEQIQAEYNDDFLDEPEEIDDYIDENVKVDNLSISYKNGIYKLTFDLNVNGKSREITKRFRITKKAQKTLKNKKKSNNKLEEDLKIDKFLYITLKNIDNTYNHKYKNLGSNIKLAESYLNGDLSKYNATVDYDVSSLKFKNLGPKFVLKQYKTALNQENFIGANVKASELGSYLMTASSIIDEIKLKHSEKVEKRRNLKQQVKNQVMNSSNEEEKDEKNIIEKIKEIISNIEFSDREKKFYRIALPALAVVWGLSGLVSIGNKKDINEPKKVKEATKMVSKKEAKPKTDEAAKIGKIVSQETTEGISQINKGEKITEEKKSEINGYGIGDTLRLVSKNAQGEIIRNPELTSDPAGQGRKYLASSVGYSSFVVSSFTIYNKEDGKIIEVLTDTKMKSDEIAKNYSEEVGISIGLDVKNKMGDIVQRGVGFFENDSDVFRIKSEKTEAKEENKENSVMSDDKIYGKIDPETNDIVVVTNSGSSKTKENTTEKTNEKVSKNKEENEAFKYSKENPPKETKKHEVTNDYPVYKINDTVELVSKDKNGNIIKSCTLQNDAWGNGKSGNAKYVYEKSYTYKIYRIEVYKGKETLFETRLGDGNLNIDTKKLYEKFGDEGVSIAFNFYVIDSNGKMVAKDIGWVEINDLTKFQNSIKDLTSNEIKEDNLYNDLETSLAENEKFKGYKLTFHM